MVHQPRIVVFGVASDGTVEQWDDHPAHKGVMLRWFVDDFHFPEFGFDISRAQVPDIPPLPFDDVTVAGIAGARSWTYADIVTLACPTGLAFEPSSMAGNNRLVIAPNEPVTVSFNGLAWQVRVRAETVGAGIEVAALIDGDTVRREPLDRPGAALWWRTRGLTSITISGEGSISLIGFHLLDDASYWTHLAHVCLPVHDPNYPCGPRLSVTEADEARSRLPASVAAQWHGRFDASFNALLPALHRLARGEPAAAVPPDTLDPRSPHVAAADERTILRLASLDPHAARILGLAYDDAVTLDGREYAYKVTGAWRGPAHALRLRGQSPTQVAQLVHRAGAEVDLDRRGLGMEIRFSNGAADFSLDLDARRSLDWVAEDEMGNETNGTFGGPAITTLTLQRVTSLKLVWTNPGVVGMSRMRWNDIQRSVGMLPSVFARELGPPRGPPSIAATIRPPSSPSGTASADLDWPLLRAPDGSVTEGEVVAHQVGHRRLDPNPTASVPPPSDPRYSDVLRPPAPIYLPMDTALATSASRVLHRDDDDGQGLAPGVWGWWVRGVDLFGRVSVPSAWTTAPVVDTAPAPSPVMVQAEWVQRNLPEITVAVVGRSVEANRWLTASSEDDGLVASWTLPPEQTELRRDIDGFRLLLRTARTQPGGAPGSPLIYPDWPAPIATFGPIPITSTGVVTSAPVTDPPLTVTLSAGETMPASPHAPNQPTTTRTAFRTDIELDGASSVFVGGTLMIGASALPVVANSDGPNLVVVVEHPVNNTPTPGTAALRAPSGRLIEIASDAPDLAGAPNLTARTGVLQAGDRFVVLRKSGTTFLCLRPAVAAPLPLPSAGDAVTWHPVWCAALDDAGFGLHASAAVPVVNAQVAVQAVRLTQSLALASAPSAPLTVTAVDVERPATPGVVALPFDPTATCAQLASRADWYGESRFTFAWTDVASCTFTVYRALADEVFRLDREHMSNGGVRDLSEDMWPPDVWSDPARTERVEADLAALEAASPEPDAWEAAYNALRVDAQMLLAGQVHTWPAFMPLFGRPIAETSYTDTLNGRTRAHWLYAVTARSRAGTESAPSEISPPICCPDVVPPAPPLAHSALAAPGAVKLKWLASPDADTHHYEVLAARQPALDLDRLTPVATHALGDQPATATATYAPNPHVSGRTIERLVPRTPQEMGDWCFWIVAVDTSGNRSAPSRMLRGRPLKLPPPPPVWNAPSRTVTSISLSWTHATDQRLACMVERKRDGAARWVAVSDWLPRGVYAYDDVPDDLAAAWTYRVRVRDHDNQHATEIPDVLLPESP